MLKSILTYNSHSSCGQLKWPNERRQLYIDIIIIAYHVMRSSNRIHDDSMNSMKTGSIISKIEYISRMRIRATDISCLNLTGAFDLVNNDANTFDIFVCKWTAECHYDEEWPHDMWYGKFPIPIEFIETSNCHIYFSNVQFIIQKV